MPLDRPPASAVVRPCGTVTSSPDSPRPRQADGERRHELVAGLSFEAIHAENWRTALLLMELLPDGFRYAMPSTPGTGNRFVRGIVLHDGRETVRFDPGLLSAPISALWSGE